MVDNFYVGVVCHYKKTSEKLVLYSDDNYNYYDLLNNKIYTTNSKNKEYVISSSIIPTDIVDYKIDYLYLLNNHKISKKRKKFNFIKS